MHRSKLRIAVAEDHAILRKSIVSFLTLAGFNNIIFEVSSGEELFKNLQNKKIDLLIMDVILPGIGALSTMQKLTKEHPEVPVIVLSGSDDEETVLSFVDSGARAFLSKNSSDTALVDAMEGICSNGYYMDQRVNEIKVRFKGKRRRIVDFEQLAKITKRERVIIGLICESLTNKQIAAKLGIAVKTVENYRQRIYKKTNSHSVVDILRFAQALRIAWFPV